MGAAPTLLRESIGSCLYFLTYESVRRAFVGPGRKSTDAPLATSILAGGCAGVGYWAFIYPIDYIKTLVQSDDLKNRKYKGMIDCYNQRKIDGLKSFFRGYSVCMMRSVPVNAGGFLAFELVMRELGRSHTSE